MSSTADNRAKLSAVPRMFGTAPAQPVASGGFGRRKTPIPETTDGAVPDSVANDSMAVVAQDGAAGANDHPFFSDHKAQGEPAAKYDGPLSVTDELPGELLDWLSAELRDRRAAQHDSVLCALGALAGYAAQQAIRETVVKPGRLSLDEAFVVIETRSGEAFFFGDLLNAVIGVKDAAKEGSQYSIWKIVTDAGRQAGASSLPDLNDIVKHSAATVGSAEFGVPRLSDVYMPAISPREAVNRFWPAAQRRLGSAGPMSWPLHFAMAAHKLIIEAKETVRPNIAVRIVMEAAVPMSKIDPLTVPKN